MDLSVRSVSGRGRATVAALLKYDRFIGFQQLVIVSWHSGAAGMVPDPQGGSAKKGEPSQ